MLTNEFCLIVGVITSSLTAIILIYDYWLVKTNKKTISKFCLDFLMKTENKAILILTGAIIGAIVGIVTGFILGHLFWPQIL